MSQKPATDNKYVQFRGEPRALVSHGSSLAFVTVHPEGQPTALYRLGLEDARLAADPLPAGGVALALAGDRLYIAGSEGQLSWAPLEAGEPKPLGPPLSPAPTALDRVGGGDLEDIQLVALCGEELVLVSAASGRELQRSMLGAAGTALAVDPSGSWVAVGLRDGTLRIFERVLEGGRPGEDARLKHSSSGKLHRGEITALLFERGAELRVLSTGVDKQILVTHARGALEPENRSGKSEHAEPCRAMIHGDEGRFYTAGRDAVIKAWPGTSGQKRPVTFKDKVGKVVALTMTDYRGRVHLAAACADSTLRVFSLEKGKPQERVLLVHGAYGWAVKKLRRKDPAIREGVLKTLARYNDAQAIELLGNQARVDEDHGLKVKATELLGASQNPRAIKELEQLLRAPEEAVRVAAFAGLRALEGESSLRPIELALSVGRRDIGVIATGALAKLAESDELAMDRLVKALNDEPREVRTAALVALERLHEDSSPEADILSLRSSRADVRELALVRLWQRELIGRPEVAAALRRFSADDNAEVRQTAYLISLLRRPILAEALRVRDKQIDRQLDELARVPDPSKPAAVAGEADRLPDAATEPEETKGPEDVPLDDVGEEDKLPLLEAMSSRARDTCLAGAKGLALLEDARALGTLLQLSRETAASVRVETCRALQALGDPRGAGRLRLLMRDSDASVRDAAFTALARLERSQPLVVAEAGLLAEHEDVRRRGLEMVVGMLKRRRAAARRAVSSGGGDEEIEEIEEIEEVEEVEEVEEDSIASLEADAAAAVEAVDGGDADTPDTPALRLLERALGDASVVVRREAFKAVLNLEVKGGGARSLRFALRSIHADIRREVLTEVTAQISESWAWPLLLELFEDPDPGVRGEAFKFAMKRTKGVGLEPLSAALKGRYSDLRIEATKILGKRKAEGIRALLSTAVDDEDEAVRQLAIDALLVNEAEDALKEAMRSEYPDVAVRAAEARAAHGDLGAEKPLLAVLAEPEPEIPALRAKWTDRVLRALAGLAALGKPDARAQVRALLEHKDAKIRRKAATALAWMARPDALAELQDALQHSDKVVQREAALGLAYCGDPSGASIIFSARDRDIPPMTRMYAALALGAQADDVFMSFLDARGESVRERALLLLLLNELCENDGIPDRCLATLASAHPRVRLVAAQALEVFNESEAFAEFVGAQFNRRGDNKPAWKIDAEIVASLGELIAHGDVLGNPQIKVRAAQLLEALDAERQEGFDRQWAVFSRRYANAIAERQAVASLRARAELAYASSELREIVFGAYTGLSRLPGGAAETRIRQTALARLVEIAEEDKDRRGAVISVLRLALVDAQAIIRKLAFESLQKLEMDGASLATEALASGHRDCGALGLKLLSSLGSASAGLAVLEDVLVQHTDGLEHEAAKLLAELRSTEKGDPAEGLSGEEAAQARERARKAALIVVHARALAARSESMRDEAVRGLAGAYEEGGEGPAAAGLRAALGSRFRKVRFAAASLLADRGDAASYEVLVEMLRSDRRNEQREAINRLRRLGDGRAPSAFMDRIEHDPAGSAMADELLKAAGGYRQVADAPRLLQFLEKPKRRRAAWGALLSISGHDQTIEDPEDKTGRIEEWELRQHPRHDDVLANMMRAGYRLGEDRLLEQVMPAARWSRRSAVNSVLATLCEYSRPAVRHAAVEALGWRVRQRGAEVDALLGALRSGDPETQFFAAEGLALAGYGEGVTVLLTCIDLLPNLRQRQRAVKALGELADPRALDPLLRLVTDDGHALQEQAAEALGHMGKAAPEKAERVFGILSRLSKGTGGVARQALTGLRWFGTRDAWALIRERARDDVWQIRQRVAELLEHNDTPSTRALLVDRLKHEGYFRVARALAKAFRALSGPDSLEPDYVFLQSAVRNLEPNTVERLRERGDPGRILELLSQLTQEEHRGVLVASLMTRDPLPVDEASEQLDSAHEGTAGVAAQILGHAGARVAAAHGRRLEAFTQETRYSWEREFASAREGKSNRLATITGPLKQMLWACGRVGVATSELIESSRLGGDDPRGRQVRRAAVLALASGAGGSKGQGRLAEVAVGSDAELRTIAAGGLAAHAPQRAASLVGDILDDRASLTRLLSSKQAAQSARVHKALGDAAASVHYQGVALPHLVERADTRGLIAVLADGEQIESARLGAIEGLARIANKTALDWLANFASSADEEDEELRKAAWRAIRRAKRQRAQASETRERHYRWEVEV